MIKEHDVLGTDAHVVALSNWSAVREGIPSSVDEVGVFHFRDGRQQERWTRRIWPPWIAYSAAPCNRLDLILSGPRVLHVPFARATPIPP
jgi:hypothetical protein